MKVAAYTKGIRENGKRADIVLPSYFPEVVMFSDPAVLIGMSWASAFHIHGSDWAFLSSMAHSFSSPLNHFPNLAHFSGKDGHSYLHYGLQDDVITQEFQI
jgi:hypothetical protein